MRTRPLLLAFVLASACASQPKPAATPAVAAAPAAKPAPVAPALPPAQPSLLEYVPPGSVAALIVRRQALAEPLAYLAARPDMRAELRRYLVEHVGVDLSAVDGVVVYASTLDGKSLGIFAHIAHTGSAQLKEREVGRHGDVPMVKLNKELRAAVLPDGVVMGMENEVKAAIDRAPAAPGSVLPLLERLDGDVLLAARLVSTGAQEVDSAVQQYGLHNVTVTYDASRLLTVRVEGDAQRLPALLDLIRLGENLALTGASGYKAQALSGKVVEGAMAIMAEHEVRRLFAEIEPRLEGNALVSRYRMPASGGAFYLVGMGAAVAVPGFTKYLRTARASEAEINLRAMASALEACTGKCQAQLTSAPWTPGPSCCGQPKNLCASSAADWEHPTWKALQFSPEGPLSYRYRVVKTGKGKKASFSLQAQGDLECNGTLTEFSLVAHPAAKGTWALEPIQSNRPTD